MVNSQKKRYVAIGDLVADCYYENGVLRKIDGGGSKFNAICGLASRGNDTCVMAICGNDMYGQIAIESLKAQNVDTKFIKKIGNTTKAYHLILENDKHTSIKNCPICGKKTWYDKQLIDPLYYISYLNEDDILILDGLKDENIPILRKAKQKKVLDIGRIKRLINLKNQEILDILKQANLEILQLNETVEKYFFARFALNDVRQLFELFNSKLLIVTRGKEGADFITNDLSISKKLLYYKKEIDDTGAGDAFFSIIIQEYFDHETINENWVDTTFEKANQLTSRVVSYLGARGYLWPGYHLTMNNCSCICNKSVN